MSLQSLVDTLPIWWCVITNWCPNALQQASEWFEHSRFMVTDATENTLHRLCFTLLSGSKLWTHAYRMQSGVFQLLLYLIQTAGECRAGQVPGSSIAKARFEFSDLQNVNKNVFFWGSYIYILNASIWVHQNIMVGWERVMSHESSDIFK